MSTELRCDGVTVRYGGVTAIDDVSLTVVSGRVTALIGPNGAGKTSLLNAVVGVTKLAEGDVTVDGKSIRRMAPHRRFRLGVARTFQTAKLIPTLSVRQNVLISVENTGRRISHAAAAEQVDRALELVGMTDRADDMPGQLAHGNLRLVEIARAVAAEPKLLLLDEPAAGLNDEETDELATLIKRLADELGMGVLVVEHDMRFVVSVADEAVVLVTGKHLMSGPPRDVVRDPEVVAAYLGTPHEVDDEKEDSHVEQ